MFSWETPPKIKESEYLVLDESSITLVLRLRKRYNFIKIIHFTHDRDVRRKTMLSQRHYQIFKIVAETGSFTKAAKELYITQSAVSHTIRELEKDMELDLFDRSFKKIRLTLQDNACWRKSSQH